jgi:thiamine pyrophosphate-dependent acetolactate synthase large subunit-like protein
MTGTLHRRDVVNALLSRRSTDTLVIAGLGQCAYDITAVSPSPRNFGLLGGMGLAVPIGIGLATAQPDKRVIVITGDGEMLMGLGSLTTVATQQLRNLAIVILDNERFGETGGQPTPTAGPTNLSAMAAAAGIQVTGMVTEESKIQALVASVHEDSGPVFYTVKVLFESLPMGSIELDGVRLKDQFRDVVLGEGA